MDGLPPSARLIGVGFYVALCIALGTLGGRELDKVTDTQPLFTLLGLLLGLFFALYGFIKQLMEVLAEINRRAARRGKKSD